MTHFPLDDLDFEKTFLEDCFRLIDSRLEKLEGFAHPTDPDQFGLFDSMEHIVGVGFVAAQRYISSVCSWLRVPRNRALQLPPEHLSGQPYVQVIVAAANYWKHIEDQFDGDPVTIHRFTREPLEAIGVKVPSEYATSNVLYECGFKRMMDFIPILEKWRLAVFHLAQEEVQQSGPDNPRPCGTFGPAPADSAPRAGARPKASGGI